nr:hypothetical protein Q903MT_gene174 [Picea sitchensis]
MPFLGHSTDPFPQPATDPFSNYRSLCPTSLLLFQPGKNHSMDGSRINTKPMPSRGEGVTKGIA